MSQLPDRAILIFRLRQIVVVGLVGFGVSRLVRSLELLGTQFHANGIWTPDSDGAGLAVALLLLALIIWPGRTPPAETQPVESQPKRHQFRP